MQRLWKPVQTATVFVFMKIAEPRFERVLQFFIYLFMALVGLFILTTPPWSLRDVLGQPLVALMGVLVATGGGLGAIAVLPGVWWLERAGIVALGPGLSMYLVAIVALGAPAIGFIIGVALIATFAQRWMNIRRFQLAPKRG